MELQVIVNAEHELTKVDTKGIRNARERVDPSLAAELSEAPDSRRHDTAFVSEVISRHAAIGKQLSKRVGINNEHSNHRPFAGKNTSEKISSMGRPISMAMRRILSCVGVERPISHLL